jgi:hypothetical protein
MAAKQGLTAQLSQASEDAKRAVLSRTGVTSSWFSNLNTVCTIKSAPPRSPEVLQMLASKSGWLFKRNEQHVWQARWCCVVPHTFLYYFDANVVPGHAPSIPTPTLAQQEEMNKAVQLGYANRKQHEKRSGLYLFNNNNNNNNNAAGGGAATIPEDALPEPPAATVAGPGGGASEAFFSNSQPAGIIDLECYTSVHRSTANPKVLELAGDDQVNPDLRAFYFCTNDQGDSEDWTDALLHGRHAGLTDECDAYKQVCDGFAQQLQVLHADLDDAQKLAEESSDELYRVRSHTEDVRRSCWRLVEDCFMAAKISAGTTGGGVQEEFLLQLEQVRSQDMGVPAAVRLLIQYTETTQTQAVKAREEKESLQADLQNAGQSDQAKVNELQAELDSLRKEYTTDKKQWESQVETLTAKCQVSQKELQDVQKDLSSTRMEVTMYQSQQKNKMAELQQHKKILKKEVIDLRSALDDAQSELAVVKHQHTSHAMRADQERQKSQLLERYVEKMESQVKVQQNMMEMMSQSGSVFGGGGGGGGSVYGGRSVGHLDQHPYSSPRVVVVQHSDDVPEDLEDEEMDNVAEGLLPVADHDHGRHDTRRSNPNSRRNLVDDVDNRSHFSELTEDMTQRHIESFSREYSSYHDMSPAMSRNQRKQVSSPRTPGPPSYIIGVNDEGNDDGRKGFNKYQLQTISSAASLPAAPHTPPVRRREIPRGNRHSDSMSVSSDRLSVAQRARLEADRQATPVRARLDEKSRKAIEKKMKASPSRTAQRAEPETPTSGGSIQGSQQSRLWRRMEEVVLGPRSDDESSASSADESSVNSTRVSNYSDGMEDDRLQSRGSSGTRQTWHARRKSGGVSEEKKSSDESVSVSIYLCVCNTIVEVCLSNSRFCFLPRRTCRYKSALSCSVPSN